MGGLRTETLAAVFINSDGRYIRDEFVMTGRCDRIDARYRFIVQRAFEADAAALLLVHNHPSGNPRPSIEDIRFTRAVSALTRALDLRLEDHLVVTHSAAYSILLGRFL